MRYHCHADTNIDPDQLIPTVYETRHAPNRAAHRLAESSLNCASVEMKAQQLDFTVPEERCEPLHQSRVVSLASVGSALVAPLIWLARAIVLRRVRRESRDAFSHLLALDDRMLDDLGVTREMVERAAKQPLKVNAAATLQQEANLNRRRHMSR